MRDDAPSPLSRPAPPTGCRDVLRVRVGLMALYFDRDQPLTFRDFEALRDELFKELRDHLDEAFNLAEMRDSIEGTDRWLAEVEGYVSALDERVKELETEP